MSLYLRVRGSTSRRRDAWVRIREARCIASRQQPGQKTHVSLLVEKTLMHCVTDHHFVGAFLTFRLVKVVIAMKSRNVR